MTAVIVKDGVVTTTVVNLRREPFDVYIGRAGKGQDGYFGNPFPVKVYGQAALTKFEEWFLFKLESDSEYRRRLLELRGRRLGCFCKPGPCHGDTIAAWVNAQPETR